MKKNRLKKLALHRETLAELDRPELKRLAGGTGYSAYCGTQYHHGCPSVTCYPDHCYFSGQDTCTTCNLTCTTNYC